jgi:hypothetical protein
MKSQKSANLSGIPANWKRLDNRNPSPEILEKNNDHYGHHTWEKNRNIQGHENFMGYLGCLGGFCSRTLNPLRRRKAHSLVTLAGVPPRP